MLTILALLLAAAPAGAEGSESNIREDQGVTTLWTTNGMRLGLDPATGRVLSLMLGNEALSTPSACPVRFEEVAEEPAAPELLTDPSSAAWGMPETAMELQNGAAWIRVEGEAKTFPRRTVHLAQTEARPLILSGQCRATVEGEAFGWWSRRLALNANGVYASGERMTEVSAYFGQYDHEAQENRRVICPDAPLASLDIDLSAPPGKCTAWYTGLSLKAARYVMTEAAAPLRRADAAVQQEFRDEATGLAGIVTWQPRESWIEVRCQFWSAAPLDRAVSATLAIPLDATGGAWCGDGPRQSRSISGAGIYRDALWYGAGRDGNCNRYPFGAVTLPGGQGLALGVSIEEPRVFQTEYDAARREFRIRFDIALSPDTGKWANRGAFTAYLIPFEGRDGFRGAATAFQSIYPWAYANKLERQGIWLAFLSPTAIPGAPDKHGIQFVEAVSNMGWEEQQGIYSLRYAEPWLHHHELPGHVEAPEVHGPALPRLSLDLAARLKTRDDLPLDMKRRYSAYASCFTANKWGDPDGYFFRSPTGGRNENMMIVNPEADLPPPPDAPYSLGGWDRDIIRETAGVDKQWYIPGWHIARTSIHSFPAVTEDNPAEGARCLRLDPVEGVSYFEQYLRGVSQAIYTPDATTAPITLRARFRGANMPPEGPGFNLEVQCYAPDGRVTRSVVSVAEAGAEWTEVVHSMTPETPPAAVRVTLSTPGAWTPNGGTFFMDAASLTQEGHEWLVNGGFEQAELMPCKLDGVYLDTVECYEGNLNYRREHWPYADEPPTFDCGRAPALHQIFTHVGYARDLSNWLRPRGMMLFGNCVPRTPFAAGWFDAIGDEQNWKQGGEYAPGDDGKLSFARVMAGAKPVCLLQYGDLTAEEQERYVLRCLFYGIFPSNQAAPSGGWYWHDPIVVRRHRAVFERYVPLIKEVAQAGWRPLTLATAENPDIWTERFGDGPVIHITVLNTGETTADAVIHLDPRLGVGAGMEAVERITGAQITLAADGESLILPIGPGAIKMITLRRSE